VVRVVEQPDPHSAHRPGQSSSQTGWSGSFQHDRVVYHRLQVQQVLDHEQGLGRLFGAEVSDVPVVQLLELGLDLDLDRSRQRTHSATSDPATSPVARTP